MLLKRVQLTSMAIPFLFLMGSVASPAQSDRLNVNEQNDAYVISVPISRLTLTIPKGGFSPKKNSLGGAAGSSRYFEIEDKTLGLIVSGWFEAEQNFPGVKRLCDGEVKGWKSRGLPGPKNVSFEKFDKWDAITYDMSIPGACNSHIRAEWTEAGTWIDLHASATGRSADANCKDSVAALLKTFQIEKKK